MRPSLEAILDESLQGLRDLSAQTGVATEEPGPMEGLTIITAEQISADVVEHIKDERYNDEENCRQVCEDYLVQNEAEHAAIRRDIAEVSDTVQTLSAAMEMAGVVMSMESLDDCTITTANVAFNNIATQAGDVLPPVLVAEDGKLTTASMEGLGDFLKTLLTRLKKWIKEKFENMTISMRRGAGTIAAMNKRLNAILVRLDGLPADYGIPAKAVKLDGKVTSQLYFDGKQVQFNAAGIKAAGKEVSDLLQAGIAKIHPDAVKRSDKIADSIAGVLAMRDEIAASDALHKLFKEVGEPLPAAKIVKGLKETAGLGFYDGSVGYRSRYRDVEWILELVMLVEAPVVCSRPRLNGVIDNSYQDVDVLRGVAKELGDLLADPLINDYAYYDELCQAWYDASEIYERLWDMVSKVEFSHMSNELWRGFDVAVTAMFTFLDKAYYSIEHLRVPYFRLADGALYVLEEQLKGYVAVNR